MNLYVIIGLSFDIVGTLILASTLWISRKHAEEEATARRAVDEIGMPVPHLMGPNAELVRRWLRNRWVMVLGAVLLVVGFAIQIVGNVVP